MDDILRKCNRWSELDVVLKSTNIRMKGDIFELLIKLVFMYHEEYNENIKGVYGWSEVDKEIGYEYRLGYKDNIMGSENYSCIFTEYGGYRDVGIDIILETNKKINSHIKRKMCG